MHLPDGMNDLLRALRRHADNLAAYYGGHVYLVGSALHSERPRDIDLRIILPLVEFHRLWGTIEHPLAAETCDVRWAMLAEERKVSRRLSDAFGWLYRFDVQFQTPVDAQRYADKQREQVDAAPEWVLAAGDVL